jgi:hypothetical protein
MPIRFLFLILLGFLGSCSDSATVSDFPGSWQRLSGDLLSGSDEGTLQFIDFRSDGTGTRYNRYEGPGILNCEEFTYSVGTAGTVAIEFDSGSSVTAGYVPAAGRITLTDSEGVTVSLDSVGEIPADSRCRTFSDIDVTADLDPYPVENTDIVYDGALLWYSGFPEISLIGKRYPFDPVAGTVGSGVDFGTETVKRVGAFQDPYFWCYAGAVELRLLDDANGVWGQVDLSAAGFDRPSFGISGAAWDGTYLWVNGRDGETGPGEILQIDPAPGGPLFSAPHKFPRIPMVPPTPVLVAANDFDVDMAGLAWDGTNFWTIASPPPGPVVVRIDPADMTAVATYFMPGVSVTDPVWMGVESVGDDLYLLARDESGAEFKAVIARVTP